MSVTVFARSGSDVLISQNGVFLQDKLWKPKDIFDNQRVTTIPPNAQSNDIAKAEAIKIFQERAQKYTEVFRRNKHINQTNKVKFANIGWKSADASAPNRFSTKFMVPSDDVNRRPPGFIKGTYPDPLYPGETAQQAIAREFREETGMSFPVEDFRQIHAVPNVFILNVPEFRKNEIIQSWKAMDNAYQGELFELRWEPISNIYKNKELLNQDSQNVIKYLSGRAGRRTIRKKKSTRSKRKENLKR